MPSTRRVRIVENIPDQDALDAIIRDYKADGATVGWSRQPDGKFRIEAFFNEDPSERPETLRSTVSGEELNLA